MSRHYWLAAAIVLVLGSSASVATIGEGVRVARDGKDYRGHHAHVRGALVSLAISALMRAKASSSSPTGG